MIFLVRICVFRRPEKVNVLSHVLHLCDFSPRWVSWCFFNSPAWVNDLSQIPHLCGLFLDTEASPPTSVLSVISDQSTVMQALLDFTLSSGQQWAAAVVFACRFSDRGVLFPVWHAEAALAEAASVLWWVAEGRLGAGAAIYGWMGSFTFKISTENSDILHYYCKCRGWGRLQLLIATWVSVL